MPKSTKAAQATLELAIGIQIYQYGGLSQLPESVVLALKKRAAELDLIFPDDFDL